MNMKFCLMTAATALVISAAIPVFDTQVASVELNSAAYADWEDNDEARRTARRVANRHEDQSTQPVVSLPAGCYTQVVSGAAYQSCNGVLYQPVPGQTTYIVVQPPVSISTLPTGCISKQVGSAMFFECGAQVYKSVVLNGQPVYQLQ